jgi:hypothetical protein
MVSQLLHEPVEDDLHLMRDMLAALFRRIRQAVWAESRQNAGQPARLSSIPLQRRNPLPPPAFGLYWPRGQRHMAKQARIDASADAGRAHPEHHPPRTDRPPPAKDFWSRVLTVLFLALIGLLAGIALGGLVST